MIDIEDWYDSTLSRVSSRFLIFLKETRLNAADQPAVLQLATNAVLAGLLRRIVVELQATYQQPEGVAKRLQEIEQRTFDRVIIVAEGGVPVLGPKDSM